MALFSPSTEKVLLIVAGVGAVVGGYVIYKTGKAVKDVVTTDLNPVNPDNIVNRGVSAVVQNATGGRRKNLGQAIYCLFNPDTPVCRPDVLASAHRNEVSFYGPDGKINDAAVQLFEQEREFYEEDIL